MSETRAAAAVSSKPRSLPMKVLYVLRRRPGHLWSFARTYFLFAMARLMRSIPGFRPRGVELGENVRLQRSRSVMAEAPDARVRIGANSIVYENASLSAYGTGSVEVGEYSILGDIRIVSKRGIRIGRRFLSSWNVFIQDYDSHPVDAGLRGRQVQDICSKMRPWWGAESPVEDRLSPSDWNFPGERIEVGDDVWIGANCTILKGARIGDGCVVASGSVVTRGDYPAGSLVGGNPARVIKSLKRETGK